MCTALSPSSLGWDRNSRYRRPVSFSGAFSSGVSEGPGSSAVSAAGQQQQGALGALAAAFAGALRRTSQLFVGGGDAAPLKSSVQHRRTSGGAPGGDSSGVTSPGLVATVLERVVTIIQPGDDAAEVAPGFGVVGIDLGPWRAAGWSVETYPYTPGEGAAGELLKHLVVRDLICCRTDD